MILAEVAEREAVQVPAVRRIAEGAEVGVMRRDDVRRAARPQQAMKLFHRRDHVSHMLDHMHGAYLVENAIPQRIWMPIEIADHIRCSTGDAVKSDGAGIFVYPTADIEDPAL